MRYFSKLKNSCWLFLVPLFLFACSSRRADIKILLFTRDANHELEDRLREAGRSEWIIEKVSDPNLLTDDFMQEFSSVVTTFSSLNHLDHRSVATLKRYFEAGGGGVVAIKDTLHSQQDWAWLVAWNHAEPDTQLTQDNSHVVILSASLSTSRISEAVTYAVGDNNLPDYRKATTLIVPEASRYTYRILSQGMDEPMQMAILPDNNVLLVERKGAVKFYDDSSKQTKTIAQFDVFSGIEDGLLGVALDPDYEDNHWVYFYYAVAGEKSVNRLSRMELKGDQLNMRSEKALLEIPTQRIYCCHSAGYLGFGSDGLLYLSTGDNTNAEDTEDYVPIDERPGRELSDDQATAANSNDLRGKILRIKPEPDGGYSIPDGNLFPKDGSKGLPEIYVMGCRNPYRFSIDSKTNFLYWGDVGPDTKVDASEGTLSYDEINQAREPGFYGWPYFLGENEAFPHYNFATKKEGPKFDPLNPINASPNNTGVRELPPAQPAMIWYGDGPSERFPLIGTGGQSAMAGPVYYSDLFPSADFKLSGYYNKKLFIYDWVRRWFMAVTLDEAGNYVRMEPFLDHLEFVAPTDMQFARDGAIYILEYGTNWFAKNADARLIRIEYSEGNRSPVANINVTQLYGAAPFTVQFSAEESMDFDEQDVLKYTWHVEGKEIAGAQFEHTFSDPGVYEVGLTVLDNHGEAGRSSVRIYVGNAPPRVDIISTANRSFYWDNISFPYQVRITDQEDKKLDSGRAHVSLNFLPRGKDLAVILTNPGASGNVQFIKGKTMLDERDCKACHSLNQESIGPSYTAIAKRYSGKPEVVDELAGKIIQGGTGNWGDRPMSSHPDMPMDEAREIVRYILSLTSAYKSLPLESTVTLNEHAGKGNEGSYLFMASYTDHGANGMEPLSSRSYIALRNPLVEMEDFDEGNVRTGTITTEFLTFVTGISHGSFVKFDSLDLSYVTQLRYRVQSHGAGGDIEVRLDSKDGKVISTINIPSGNLENRKNRWKEVRTTLVEKVSGRHDVYLIFLNPREKRRNLFNIDWIYFDNR